MFSNIWAINPSSLSVTFSPHWFFMLDYMNAPGLSQVAMCRFYAVSITHDISNASVDTVGCAVSCFDM